MKLFYGWVIVGAGMLITCIGLGTTMAFGVFLQPMSAALGWSRADIAIATLLNFLFMGAGSFLWGAMSDRFGTRAVLLCGGSLLAAGFAIASQATTLLQFQLAFGVIAGFAAGSFYAPLTAAATSWFTKNRSLAIALVSAGIGVGSATVAPFARWLITTHDWRFATLALGGAALVVILPAALLVRPPPAQPEGARSSALGTAGDISVGQAFRTPQFATIAAAHFACCAAHSGPIFHMVSYAMDCGLPAMRAATVFSVAGLSALSGRILCGLIADRVGVKLTLVASLTVQALAISLYVLIRDASGFYALAAMFGIAYGGVMPLYAALVREYFGMRIMGTVFGAVAMASTLGMAIGPWAGGWLYGMFGGYFWFYIGSAGIGLGAVAVATTLRPLRAQPAGLALAS
jgi:MFS family permease